MTERLYYQDSYLREFDADVVETTMHEGKPALILDRTAFYPASGGQPFDVGTLSGVTVEDVVEAEDGRILHIVDRVPDGAAVKGTVDWVRRFDHMQQHTGQHVLSAAYDRLLRARTESFHLGADYATIDIARELSAPEVARGEDEANRIVWEDRPVSVRFADAGDVTALPLRKESKRQGVLRLIDVQQFDLSACGGTHVSRTGAIGLIAVAATERFRGGSRITFVCGARALTGFRTLRDAVAGSVRALSVLAADLPAAIERLQTDSKDLRQQTRDFQLKLAGHEADALADAAGPAGDMRLVAVALHGWDAAGLKAIAARIAARRGYVAVLLSEPAPSSIVVARSAGLSLDSGAILRQLIDRHGGKGGGRPELAQGGGLNAAANDVLQSARELLSGAPQPKPEA
ncbi:MAG: DHHA1 domain-containing protein [Vicinamibacterales bacterium]